jgi:hypothetical protein
VRATETKPPFRRVKRAILPAAISESADKDGGSPRPEVESSRGGDEAAGAGANPALREMTIDNRTRLTFLASLVWCL